MGKLTCGCLNVLIHTKSDVVPFDRTAISEKQHVSCCGDFFRQDLSEVLLNLEGIHVVHPSLLRTRVCASWRIHQCVNCEIFTHATNTLVPDDSRILVSSLLIRDEAAVESLMGSDDYSPAYKIVIKCNAETTPPPLTIELVSQDVRSELEKIQTQLNTFLVTEESQMEERIRSYGTAEREKFTRLQGKARSDKNTMVSRLLTTVYRSVSESLSEAMVESPVGSLIEQVHMMQVTQLPSATTAAAVSMAATAAPRSEPPPSQPLDHEDDQGDRLFPLRRLPVSRSNSTKQRPPSTGSQSAIDVRNVIHEDFHAGPIVIDDVFQFDPGFQEDPSQPFSESDEDVNDTDDSSLVDDGIQRSSHSSGNSGRGGVPAGIGFSTSVPIDVPAWMGSSLSAQSHLYQFDDDDELDSVTRDPARMAASIQAMARSVHGNSTSEIFGELPKPPTQQAVRRSSSKSSSRH